MMLLNFALDRIVLGTALDTSGNHFFGTCTGVKTIADPEGKFESCVTFNGKSSMISVAGVKCPPAFTFAVWVRPSPALSFYYATILAFELDEPYFGLNRGRPVLGNSLSVPGMLGTSWSHLAVTQEQRGTRIYVNGEVWGSSTSRASTSGTNLRIGRDMKRGDAWFAGEMAHLMIFDEALSAVAVRQVILERRSEPARMIVTTPPGPAVVARSEPPEIRLSDRPEGWPSEPPEIRLSEAPEIRLSEAPEIRLSERPADWPSEPQEGWPSEPQQVASPPHYAAHVSHLRRLHDAFPAYHLGSLITALGAELDRADSPVEINRRHAGAEGRSFEAAMGSLLLGAGGVTLLELTGVEDGQGAALCVDLAPPSLDVEKKVSVRMKGKVKLFHGAISREIDHDVHLDDGVRFTLTGGDFGDDVETTVLLRSSRCCQLELRPTFGCSFCIFDHQMHFPLTASLIARIDGSSFEQEIVFLVDLGGHEVSVVMLHDRPIMSLQQVIELFEDAVRPQFEKELLHAIERRGAEALKWLRRRLLRMTPHNR